MRYYEIEVTGGGGENGDPNQVFRQYTSHKNGVYNPGALMAEMDISRYTFDTPSQESRVSVWGVSPEVLQQDILELVGKTITVRGGMLGGLPLSREGKQGLIVRGTVLQVVGNWEGSQLRQDFIIQASPTSSVSHEMVRLGPINLTLVWRAGVKLADALAQCFTVLGRYQFVIDISDDLVLDYDSSMYCGDLNQLAVALNGISQNILNRDSYYGVRFTFQGNTIYVYDGVGNAESDSKKPITQIAFNELIGQPTWIKYGVVSLVMAMRSDMIVGNKILLPANSRPIGISQSNSQLRDRLAFTGVFRITKVRFVGNSRDPNAANWATIVEAIPEENIEVKKDAAQ